MVNTDEIHHGRDGFVDQVIEVIVQVIAIWQTGHRIKLDELFNMLTAFFLSSASAAICWLISATRSIKALVSAPDEVLICRSPQARHHADEWSLTSFAHFEFLHRGKMTPSVSASRCAVRTAKHAIR